jgi:hypothetical protein
VEPLSDITWARVERNLWERLDAGEPASVLAVTTPSPWRKRMVWVAAPLAAAAALAIVVSMRSGEDTPSGQGSDGPMRVVSSGASSSVSYGDAHVTLDAESAVVMSRAAEETTAIVERGAAWFAIAPRGDRPPFVVVAGDTTVRVVGTRFRVARFAEITTVEVEHGLVDARFRGRRVSIGAGQSWTSAHPDDVAPVRTAAVTPVPTPETPARVEPVLPEPPAPTVREPKPIDPPPPPTPPAPPTTRPEPTPGSSATKPSAPGKPKPAKPGSADDDRVRFEKLAALETRDPAAGPRSASTLPRASLPIDAIRAPPTSSPSICAASRAVPTRTTSASFSLASRTEPHDEATRYPPFLRGLCLRRQEQR